MAAVGTVWRRPRRKSSGAPIRGLLPLALVVAAWQLLGDERSLSFPPPDAWLSAIARMHAEEGVLLRALADTLLTFSLSLVAATIGGAAIGLAIGASQRVDRALTPTLDFFRTLPPPALVPVATLLLGTTLLMSVSTVAIIIVWPILLNTVTATRTIPPVRLEMAQSLGLAPGERLRKVVLPSLAPGIVLGVRIAVSVSLIVTLLVDILASGDGAGRLIVERQQIFDAAAVWGLLLIIGAFGYTLNALLAIAEQSLFRHWPAGIDR